MATGEQEGEQESTTVAIAILVKRNLRSTSLKCFRIEGPCRLEP